MGNGSKIGLDFMGKLQDLISQQAGKLQTLKEGNKGLM